MDKSGAFRKEVAYFMRRLYKRGLTTTSGGNISLKLSDVTILITASQTDKGRMKADDVARIDFHGRNLSARLKPSMETGMHLAVYNRRPDIKCIIHAHPPIATAFAVAHKNINTAIIGEAYALAGKPSLAKYALMGSEALANAVAEAAADSNLILMANHGVMALGASLLEAFDRLEVLENCARIELASGLIGNTKALNDIELKAIDKLIKPST
jgi:L-fuculose-phosphate aldolase